MDKTCMNDTDIKCIDRIDSNDFAKYCGPAIRDKAMNSLIGILEGINIDKNINPEELYEIKHWCQFYRKLSDKRPFDEVFEILDIALEDDVISNDELQDIIWCCKQNLGDGEYYDLITSGIQNIQGMLHGILADGEISNAEIYALRTWLWDHEEMKSTYPYDELCSIVSDIVKDGIITENERNTLKVFFSQFFDIRLSANVHSKEISQLKEQVKTSGICAMDPEIMICNKQFCFTGASSKTKRADIAKTIEANGGKYHDSVTLSTDYLIIGDEGNPYWAYSCYGRKIEKAMSMRKDGKRIIIAHENDFWDVINL